jgi:hypothetical protein
MFWTKEDEQAAFILYASKRMEVWQDMLGQTEQQNERAAHRLESAQQRLTAARSVADGRLVRRGSAARRLSRRRSLIELLSCRIATVSELLDRCHVMSDQFRVVLDQHGKAVLGKRSSATLMRAVAGDKSAATTTTTRRRSHSIGGGSNIGKRSRNRSDTVSVKKLRDEWYEADRELRQTLTNVLPQVMNRIDSELGAVEVPSCASTPATSRNNSFILSAAASV